MKQIVKPAAVLLTVCVVVALLLAGTQVLTKDRIAALEAEQKAEAILSVLPAAQTAEALERAGMDAYAGRDAAGNLVGYAFVRAAKGYGGDVSVTAGFDMEGRLTGIAVSAPDETPGLGVNVQKDSFLSQFDGIDAGNDLPPVVSVTSATYSSKAVEFALAAILLDCRAVLGEEASE